MTLSSVALPPAAGGPLNDRPLPHVCVYVDTSASGEARRGAALTHTPLVAIRDVTAGAAHTMRTPVLRVTHEGESFPSTAGRVVDLAFDEVAVRPNQPELGEIARRIGDEPLWRHSERGAAVVATVLPETMLVRGSTPGGPDSQWMTSRLSVRRLDGLFPVTRDGLCVSDLQEAIDICHDGAGLVEIVVPSVA